MILSLLFALASVTTAIDVFELNAPKIFAKFAADQLEEKGHAVLSDGSLRDPMMLSNTLKEVNKFYPSTHDFSYTLGNVQGRTSLAPGIHKIGGAPKQVLVSGHSEAAYLSLSPRFLLFSCLKPSESGGETPIYNIKELEQTYLETDAGRQMWSDVYNQGVVYVRNDVSRDNQGLAPAWENVGYPFWQDRFQNMTRSEIVDMLESKGMIAYFDDQDTLHSEWHFGGLRPHPDSGEMVWMNQLYAMNGRYWRQHLDQTILSLPLDARPLSSRIGSLDRSRQLTEEEYQIMDQAHFTVQETFDWEEGRVLFVDNFIYQHGRLPYEGERRCVVGWGPPTHFDDEFVAKPSFEEAPSGITCELQRRITANYFSPKAFDLTNIV